MKLPFSVALIASTALLIAEPTFFTVHVVNDPASGIQACRYLLPKGWLATDKVTWNPQNRTMPAQVASSLASPDGTMLIQMLPAMGGSFEVKGGHLTGSLPPEKATAFLGSVFANSNPDVKSARKDSEFNPEVPFEVGEGMKSKGLCGVLQITFNRGGKPYVEYLTGTEYEYSKQESNGDVSGTWRLTNCYTVTSGQGDYQRAYTLFATVAISNTTTPSFFQLLLKAVTSPPDQEIDPKQLVGSGGNLSQDEASAYGANLQRHREAMVKAFPIFHDPHFYASSAGPIFLFGSFGIFADQDGNLALDESQSSPAPFGFKAVKPLS